MDGKMTKDDIAYFNGIRDVYLAMKDGRKVDKTKQAKLNVALQAFMGKPVKKYQKHIQAVGVSTDFAIVTKDSFNVNVQMDDYDMGWDQSFRKVTLGKGQDSWEIYEVGNSLTFYKVEEGQRIEVAGLSGTKVQANVEYYGGAIGWTDKMIRFRKVPAMVQMAEIFRNNFYINKADNHYALLAAAAALNVTAYAGVAANGQLQRDIQTINAGCFALADRCKDKGYGNMANPRLLMYYNPLDKNRIAAALRATTTALATAGATGDTIGYNITPIPTFNSNIVAGSPILVLPGNKIQCADAMTPTVFNQEQDALTLNRLQAVWAIYGAIVADTDQCQQITLE